MIRYGCSRVNWRSRVAGGLMLGAIAAIGLPAQAQLAPDTSLGADQSTVDPVDQTIGGFPSNVIGGGAVQGFNLFHSFQEFNVAAGRGVYFANPNGITNILTRVTGGNPSNILGRLGVLGPANLYLLNPAGIVFGSGASLDVQGSFVASTSSAITLGNGVFSANLAEPSTLVAVQPEATFLNALANVTNQANLQAGANVTLIGNAIANTGTVQAGQNLRLAANTVANTGSLLAGQNLTLNAITVSNQGTIQVGQSLTASAGTVSNQGSIQAGQTIFLNSTIIANAGDIQSGQDLTLRGNSINSIGQLLAPNGILTVNALAGNATVQQATAQTASLFAANNLNLTASQLTTTGNLSLLAQNTVQIQDTVANPFNATVGGNLLIQGTQGVTINALTNPTSSIQTAGNITVNSSGAIAANGVFTSGGAATFSGNTVSLTGSQLNATGNVLLSATRNLQLADSALVSTTGGLAIVAGGNATLQRSQLQAVNDLFLSATGILQIRDRVDSPFIASTSGDLLIRGNAGVDIQAQINPDSLLQSAGNLSVTSLNGAVTTNIGINTGGLFSVQSPGNITLGDFTGAALQLTSDGAIAVGTIDTSSSTGNGGTVSLNGRRGVSATAINTFSTGATGNGGAVTLTAAQGNINVGAIDASSTNGNGGGVSATAGNGIVTGAIATFADGTGTGGAVSLNANLDITTTGDIDTASFLGNGGTLRIVSDRGTIDTSASVLSTGVLSEDGGSGGTVFLSANRGLTVGSIFTDGGRFGGGGAITLNSGGTVAIAPNQELNSSTFGSGNGGNIAISGQSVTVGAGASVFAYSLASGNAGNITIQAANNGSITLDPDSFLDTSAFGDTGTGSAGFINLTGGSLAITNATLDAGVLNGDGTGGNVNLTATNGAIILTNSDIYTDTVGTGTAGNVTLAAPNSEIILTDSGIFAFTNGAGIAGTVTLTGRSLTSLNSTIDVAAFGTGATGSIAAQATGRYVYLSGGEFFTDTFPDNTGHAGGAVIRGTNVTLNNFRLNADSTGAVLGANILVEASDRVSLENNSALRTTVAENATGQGGTITVRGGNLVALSGDSEIDASTNGLGNGGNVAVTAPTISLSDRSTINAKTSASGQGGSIAIATGSGSLSVTADSRISTAVEGGTGNGGEIAIRTGELELLTGGQLVSSTSGSGAAGNMSIVAGERVVVSGGGSNPSGILAQSQGEGRAGDLTIATPQLLVQDGAEVSVTTKAAGAGGRLTINTQQLSVLSNAEVSASTEGSGAGGILTVNASQRVVLDGGGQLAARSSAAGDAGSLAIATNQLLIQNGAQATVSSTGTGNAGNLDIGARTATLDTGGKLTADTVSGTGGNIQLTVRNDLTIQNGAEISTSSSGAGNAGRIALSANSLFLTDGSRITSRSTATGNAGSITVNLRDRLRVSNSEISASSEQGGGGQITLSARDILFNRGSLVSSSVSNGAGGSGDITIRSQERFFAFEDSDILANAQFGDGGNITIDALIFIADLFANVGRNPGSDLSRFRGNGRVDISSSSVFGISGTVQIPDISFIQNSLSSLEDEFVSSEQVVAGSCLARRTSGQSSFVVTGTGGLARTPYSQAVGRYNVAPVRPLGNSTSQSLAQGADSSEFSNVSTPHLSWKPGDPVQEAQGFIRTPDGRVVLGTHPQLAAVVKAHDLVCGF